MADNYLERKYEDYSKGKAIIRKANPSLDSLLEEAGKANRTADSSYKVKSAQLEAVIRSARRTGIPFDAECHEEQAAVNIACAEPTELGQIILAMRLKAAELRLQTEVDTEGASARIRIFK